MNLTVFSCALVLSNLAPRRDRYDGNFRHTFFRFSSLPNIWKRHTAVCGFISLGRSGHTLDFFLKPVLGWL